jgi:hypothetical protein
VRHGIGGDHRPHVNCRRCGPSNGSQDAGYVATRSKMKTDRKAQPEMERLRRVAYHEAGHVAVALHGHISIRYSTIVAGSDYQGLTVLQRSPA